MILALDGNRLGGGHSWFVLRAKARYQSRKFIQCPSALSLKVARKKPGAQGEFFTAQTPGKV